tara:strand:- start:2447 stop:2827 length:381 start_codon:yes stop_codon:yes gene_type:complete
MKMSFLVVPGGEVGASLRYAIRIATVQIIGGRFPWGTVVVKFGGSLCFGVIIEILAECWALSAEFRLFLVVGVLGGFITFSAFSMDILILTKRNRHHLAVFYVIGTLILSLGGLFAGLGLARVILL